MRSLHANVGLDTHTHARRRIAPPAPRPTSPPVRRSSGSSDAAGSSGAPGAAGTRRLMAGAGRGGARARPTGSRLSHLQPPFLVVWVTSTLSGDLTCVYCLHCINTVSMQGSMTGRAALDPAAAPWSATAAWQLQPPSRSGSDAQPRLQIHITGFYKSVITCLSTPHAQVCRASLLPRSASACRCHTSRTLCLLSTTMRANSARFGAAHAALRHGCSVGHVQAACDNRQRLMDAAGLCAQQKRLTTTHHVDHQLPC